MFICVGLLSVHFGQTPGGLDAFGFGEAAPFVMTLGIDGLSLMMKLP
jgi:hypothetical protein